MQAQPARGGWGHPGSGHDHVGGLAGKLTASTVEQATPAATSPRPAVSTSAAWPAPWKLARHWSTATPGGDVTGSGQDSGALIGYAVAGNSVTRVYATGAAERGGLVAIDDGNTSYAECYWHGDKHVRAVGSLADDPAGTFGRSETELLLEAGYGGYDFVDVWVIEEGVGYAGLR